MKITALFPFPLALIGLLASCVTVNIPKDYVPDEKVVFLMQDTGFGPIRYKAEAADPYQFQPDLSPVDPINPKFLKEARFDRLLRADFRSDSYLYREVVAHFEYLLKLPLFEELRPILDRADIKPPSPLPPNKGEKTQDYNNGAEYVWPDQPDARISILNTGIYVIRFADKSIFQSNPNGVYFWNDEHGGTTQQYDPGAGLIVVRQGDTVYTSSPKYRSLKGPRGSLEFNEQGDPQYNLTPAGKDAALYTYFLNQTGGIRSVSLTTASGLRFDYFPGDKSILAKQNREAVLINAKYQKNHFVFDEAKKKTTELLSYYLPQGIRLTNLDSRDPGFGELNPAWPEAYKLKTIGPFNVWYTAKDEALLAMLKADRLTEIESKDRNLTGLSGAAHRSIVIPPDLGAYRRLHSGEPGEVLNWYPSGFETLDYITMWPISVPRYDKPAGQDYFFNQEIYEIICHEYVHILVGENSGLVSPVPNWLNEGLAVYVEGKLFPEAQKYWETTFSVARDLHRLLPWDDVTLKTTGEFPVVQARIHYAQSWGLVSRLMGKFGAAKVAEYVRSFRVKSQEADKTDLAKTYQENFKKVFGLEWAKALELLQPEPAKK